MACTGGSQRPDRDGRRRGATRGAHDSEPDRVTRGQAFSRLGGPKREWLKQIYEDCWKANAGAKFAEFEQKYDALQKVSSCNVCTGVKPPREACRTIIVLTPRGLSSPSLFKVSAEERAARLEEVVTTLDAPHLRASSIEQRLEEGMTPACYGFATLVANLKV